MLFYLLIVLCAVSLYFIFRRNDYWKKQKVLQVGDILWQFSTSNKSLAEVVKTLYDKHDKPHIGTSSGSIPMLILKNLDDVQAVLAGDFQSFHSRGIIANEDDKLADNILFINDYRRWKLLRQKLSPLFTSAKLRNMFYIMDKCARDFAAMVENNDSLQHKPFNAIYNYSTSSIAAALFGINTLTSNTMDSPFLDMAWKSINPSFESNLKFYISNTFPRLFNFLNLKFFAQHEEFFIGVVKTVLERRKCDTERRYDFIEMCLELQKKGTMQDMSTGFELNPTDEVLAAQAFFFFIAGTDTTANAMLFTLLELAGNPKILKKLHDEIDCIFQNELNELTYEKIEKLHYLEMVVNEALRKYPPIGFIQRFCTKDTELPTGNIKIKKDVVMVIPVYAIHRDEKYYPNPDVFEPDRFLPNNIINIPKYAYLPFGEGNRICIGARFARLQIKTGLVWLLRRFTLAEQKYEPKRFEPSPFAIRDAHANCKLIRRYK